MRFRARLHGLIATGVPSAGTLHRCAWVAAAIALSGGAAFGQAEQAGKFVGRVASDAPIMVVVVLLVVTAAAWFHWLQDKRHERERVALFGEATNARVADDAARVLVDAAREMERQRHENIMTSFVDRFVLSFDKNAKATEEQSLALERIRLILVENRTEIDELSGRLEASVVVEQAFQSDVRTALAELRSAPRAARSAR